MEGGYLCPNQTIIQVWNNKKHAPAISSVFTTHDQIVSTILCHNGDNNCLSVSERLLFGVRRMYISNEEGEGVITIPIVITEDEILYM